MNKRTKKGKKGEEKREVKDSSELIYMYMYMYSMNECNQVHNEETLTCNPLPNNELFLMSRVDSIIQQVSELMADILREREEEGGRGEGGKGNESDKLIQIIVSLTSCWQLSESAVMVATLPQLLPYLTDYYQKDPTLLKEHDWKE